MTLSLYFIFFFLMIGRPPRSPLFPYTTLSRSRLRLAIHSRRRQELHRLRQRRLPLISKPLFLHSTALRKLACAQEALWVRSTAGPFKCSCQRNSRSSLFSSRFAFLWHSIVDGSF